MVSIIDTFPFQSWSVFAASCGVLLIGVVILVRALAKLASRLTSSDSENETPAQVAARRRRFANLVLPDACVIPPPRAASRASRLVQLFRRQPANSNAAATAATATASAASAAISGAAPATAGTSIPQLNAALLPASCTPLLCLVNSKSGAKQGQLALARLRQLLHPAQVVDLAKTTPDAALRAFAALPGLRVLVAGGDGTVGWVLNCIDALHLESSAGLSQSAQPSAAHSTAAAAQQQRPRLCFQRPPVAIAPLGTGNDLARSLGWGGGTEVAQLHRVLERVARASVVPLDRWQVEIIPPMPPASSTSDSSSNSIKPPARASKAPAPVHQSAPAPPRRVIFSNYLGIGVDAAICTEFHEARERNPTRFFSQFGCVG
jgi:hypothetical protein